jgi:vacuolar-type H+-ATPase subunit D/Vma8
MSKQIFQCRLEELPIIGGFLLERVKQDLNEFNTYSPVFTPDYLAETARKIDVCKSVVSSSLTIKELKATTQKLTDNTDVLRIKLNALEGYMKLGASELDIPVADMGLKQVRFSISRGNMEGTIFSVGTLMTAVTRNQQVLERKGMRAELLSEITAITRTIEALNVQQDSLISARNRLTETNMEMFNDLWKSLLPIVETAKAMYRGVNPTKLKDYTIAQLKKRIHKN